MRHTIFPDAQPVVFNAKSDQTGILEPDSNINLELELNLHSREPEQAAQPAVTPPREEKR